MCMMGATLSWLLLGVHVNEVNLTDLFFQLRDGEDNTFHVLIDVNGGGLAAGSAPAGSTVVTIKEAAAQLDTVDKIRDAIINRINSIYCRIT